MESQLDLMSLPDTDDVFAGILPMTITNAQDDVIEHITCASIAGGARYVKGMPADLTLARHEYIRTDEGIVVGEYTTTARYIHESLNQNPTHSGMEFVRKAQNLVDAVQKYVESDRDDSAFALLRKSLEESKELPELPTVPEPRQTKLDNETKLTSMTVAAMAEDLDELWWFFGCVMEHYQDDLLSVPAFQDNAIFKELHASWKTGW